MSFSLTLLLLSVFPSFFNLLPYALCCREALAADLGAPPPTDTSAPQTHVDPAADDRAEDPVRPETNLDLPGYADVRVADDSTANPGEAPLTLDTVPQPGQAQDPVIVEVTTSAPEAPNQRTPAAAPTAPTPPRPTPQASPTPPPTRQQGEQPRPQQQVPRRTPPPAQGAASRLSAAQKQKQVVHAQPEVKTKKEPKQTGLSIREPTQLQIQPAANPTKKVKGGDAPTGRVDEALFESVKSGLTAGSASLVPMTTMNGEPLGFLEHYAKEWNDAEMCMMDGKSILSEPSLSLIAAPPSDRPDAPISTGDRILALKAMMLEADSAVEVRPYNFSPFTPRLYISPPSPRDSDGVPRHSVRISRKRSLGHRVPESERGTR